MTTISWVLLGFCFIYCTLQSILTSGWLRLSGIQSVPEKSVKFPISVIIAARNESSNLKRFLPTVLNQVYPDYEVVVVLDRCEDHSKKMLRAFQKTYQHLKIIEIHETQKGWTPKKWAVTMGVNAARHEWLAFTDADCWVPPTWLSEISHCVNDHINIVLGIGLYYQEHTPASHLTQYETLYTAYQYLGAAQVGFPYMGVGRNMAYRKSLFVNQKGLTKFKGCLSGDDDLFVNQFGKPPHVAIMTTPNSITYSLPQRTFSKWLKQKFRHINASYNYTTASKILLGLFHISHICIYLVFLLSLLFELDLIASSYILSSRLGISYILFKTYVRQIPVRSIPGTYLLLDLFIFFYNMIIVPMGLIKRPEWK